MIEIHEIQYCPTPPEVVFEWVRDVSAYAETVPFCHASGVIEIIESNCEKAFLEMGIGPFREKIITRNTYNPFSDIEMRLIEGPFETFVGTWVFTQPDESNPNMTKVELHISASLKNTLLERLAKIAIKNHRGLLLDFIEQKIKRHKQNHERESKKSR